MNLIIKDLRELGYGLGPNDPPPVLTASEYRLTLGMDRNGDGTTTRGARHLLHRSLGEDPLVSDTPNPNDRLLRRCSPPRGTPWPFRLGEET